MTGHRRLNSARRHARFTPKRKRRPARNTPLTTARLIVRAAQLLHAYGTPAHRLERIVGRLSESFGETVQIFSTPTSIFLGFERDGEDRVRMLRVEPGAYDLGKLVDLDEILAAAESHEIDARTALDRIDTLDAAAPRYPAPAVIAGHALAAAAAAVLLGGGLPDALVSLLVGGAIGVLELFSSRRRDVAGLFEPAAAFLAAAVGFAVASLSGGVVDDRVVALAAIIVVVPGLSLTVALIELTTRHLSSGTARLAGSVSAFVTIAFGALAGRAAAGLAFAPLPESVAAGAPPIGKTAAGLLAAVMVASLGFSLLFRVRVREVPWIFTSCLVGIGAVRAVGVLLAGVPEHPAIAAFAGALTVGLLANAYGRWLKRPATVPLVPGLLVLVPGSVGYRALRAFTEQHALSGVETTFQMLLLAAALVGGLLTASAVLPPRRSL